MTRIYWAHSPNAKHIDWVLASIKAHQEMWIASSRAPARSAAFDAVRANHDWCTAWESARWVVWQAVGRSMRDEVWEAVWGAVGDAILALIAYDDCAYMIESEVDEIKILAKLGVPRAILLLPACIVYNETKELV